MPPATAPGPTSDRAREALFSALDVPARRAGPAPRSSTCTPGPAPSGSRRCRRGAARVVLVESRPRRPRARSAPTSPPLGLPGARGARGRRRAAVAAAAPPGRPTTWCSPTRRTTWPTTRSPRCCATCRPRLAAPTRRRRASSGPAAAGADLAGRATSRPAIAPVRRRPLWYGRALVRSRHRPAEQPRSAPRDRAPSCPGSFDPVTNGHLDVIERAAALFDEVDRRRAGQQDEERPVQPSTSASTMLREASRRTAQRPRRLFHGLLVDYCRDHGDRRDREGPARGQRLRLRAADGADEPPARPASRRCSWPTNPLYSFLSSSLVKEVATYGGDVSGLVPDTVLRRLEQRRAARLRPTPPAPTTASSPTWRTTRRGRPRQARRALRARRERPRDADVGVVHRQPRQVLDLLDEVRGLLPTSLAHADDVLADREDVLRGRPPRRRADHRAGPGGRRRAGQRARGRTAPRSTRRT